MRPATVPATLLLALALLFAAVLPAAAQTPSGSRISPTPETEAGNAAEPGEARLALHAFALRHRAAAEAVEVVRPLLSPRGTVELQPGSNTLVVRDSLSALSRIVPALRGFDRPAQPLELEILVVRAFPAGEPASGPAVPAALERSLRGLLSYDAYRLVARAELRSREGQEVTYELGEGYSVRFRLGSVTAGRRLRLGDFRVERTRGQGDETPPLIHTNLNLWLDRTVTLGLARTEGSTSALMVAVTCHADGATEAEPEGGRIGAADGGGGGSR